MMQDLIQSGMTDAVVESTLEGTLDNAVDTPVLIAVSESAEHQTLPNTNSEAAESQGPHSQPERTGSDLLAQLNLKTLLQSLPRLNAQSLETALPALRILGLAVLAGIGLKITSAVLGAINELPLLGRLMELVGLVTAIQFLSRNALQQQKRAALLARIEQLKTDLLG